ncbi:hemolysin-type calcium-binding repeat-containing protein [Nostoc sp. 'Lobaria pulmonaria (5183) cyanobiont']|nr:hemolysin-type calcium-binding repeat-containing protein [Nostoc sp. 'Lobaria pulmonaria (5183) cyanobiont']
MIFPPKERSHFRVKKEPEGFLVVDFSAMASKLYLPISVSGSFFYIFLHQADCLTFCHTTCNTKAKEKNLLYLDTNCMATNDIVFLQDLTGSYYDDLPRLKVLLPAVVNRLTSPYLTNIFGNDLQFGLASFKDKPVPTLGEPGDYVYQKEVSLTTDAALIKTTVTGTPGIPGTGFVATGGADEPESQLEALLHAALDSSIGYRVGSKRLVFLATDATYHIAGDGAAANPTAITVANNGDGVIDPNEDYPDIAQVQTALIANDIIPVFLATSDVKSTYDGLVSSLGRGIVTTLDSNSENVADVIKFAIAKANAVITIEGTDGDENIDASNITTPGNQVVFAGAGNDTIDLFGVPGNHFVDGGAGFDVIYGGGGQDIFDGGSSDDNLYGGNGNDTLLGSSGNDVLRGQGGDDILQGDSGKDDLFGGAGNDRFIFDTGSAFTTDDLGVDIINDFQRVAGNTDTIELSRDTFTVLGSSGFIFATVSTNAAAETSTGNIVYSTGTRSLFYNANGATPGFGSGSSLADPQGGLFATFASSTPTLIATDFTIVD